jgi:hypothetical protein
MKNIRSSDIKSMVPAGMNNAAISLAMPVNTALIWGLNVFPGSPLTGTRNATRSCNAIWGTRGQGDTDRQVRNLLPTLELYG